MVTQMEPVFVGVDVAFAKKKPLPVCICKQTGIGIEPLPLKVKSSFPEPPRGKGNRLALDSAVRKAFAENVVKWLEKIAEQNSLEIKRIAIDAPRAYANGGRRAAEKAMDQRGISCFSTPTAEQFAEKIAEAQEHLKLGGKEARLPNANQFWMLVGFDLFEALSQYPCIEVFPQAIVRELGCGQGHKSTAAGLNEQIEKFAAALGKTPMEVSVSLATLGYGGRHDCLDAYMSAWIASLPEDARIACGNPPTDAIWIPNMQKVGSGGGVGQ